MTFQRAHAEMAGLFETDRIEFERAVRAHSADLFRFAYWLCRDRALAEALVLEAFHRAWHAWEGLREPVVAKSWLFCAVRNEHERTCAVSGASPAPMHEAVPGTAAAPDVALAPGVRAALDALPESLREPLLLQFLGGFSCAEIGWLLETTEDAAMTRLARARLTLCGSLGSPTALRLEGAGQ